MGNCITFNDLDCLITWIDKEHANKKCFEIDKRAAAGLIKTGLFNNPCKPVVGVVRHYSNELYVYYMIY